MTQRTPERDYVDALCVSLHVSGYAYRREARTSGGAVDVLVSTASSVALIEAKARGDARSIGQAIGQLVLYARDYPHARLFVAAPEAIEGCMLPVLANSGVEVLPDLSAIEAGQWLPLKAPEPTRVMPHLSAAQLEDLLRRRHGWALLHITELGGYREAEGGAYRFPVHGVRAYQERMATEFAAQRRAS